MDSYTTGGLYSVQSPLKKVKEKIMGSEMLHWFIIGFSAGFGYGLAVWLLGKILR